jgi:hypothetical protein
MRPLVCIGGFDDGCFTGRTLSGSFVAARPNRFGEIFFVIFIQSSDAAQVREGG